MAAIAHLEIEKEESFELEDNRSDGISDYVEQYVRVTVTPAVVTSADDDTASRTMAVLSSVSEHAHIPTNVCVGNVGGYQSQK